MNILTALVIAGVSLAYLFLGYVCSLQYVIHCIVQDQVAKSTAFWFTWFFWPLVVIHDLSSLLAMLIARASSPLITSYIEKYRTAPEDSADEFLDALRRASANGFTEED